MSATTRKPSPLVSVLMPIHNGEAFVAQAVESVLAQTLGDFELLVIDDGSTDGSAKIVAGYDDPRIRLVRNDRRLELVRTLNRGLDLARGRYVARMDADDVSLPTRLERQVAFMRARPDVGICGAWLVTMGDVEGVVWRYPTSNEGIRCRLLFGAALAHPAVCMRRELLVRHGLRYDERYPHAEDYELWTRASDLFALANLDRVLLRYRLHADGVSQRYRETQQASVGQICRERLWRLGVEPTDAELRVHRQVTPGTSADEVPALSDAGAWLEKLVRANDATGLYERSEFERLLGELWLATAYRNLDAGRSAPMRFLRSPLARRVQAGDRLRLLARTARRSLRGRIARPDTRD